MIGRPPRRSRRALAASLALAVLSSLLTVFAAASPAHADPGCVNGGAYVLFARGSGERLNDVRALSFQHYVMQALANEGVPSAWAELGNLDNHMGADGKPDDPGEYPAIPVDDWRHRPFGYFGSVSTGVDELVTHLNDRYAGNGPTGGGSCTRETLVLGGYSQGAQVIGDALRSGRLCLLE